MKEFTVSPETFDPRKLIKVVETAKTLNCKIILSTDSNDADAESYLELLSLWASKKDDSLRIHIEGVDEQLGAEKMEDLFNTEVKV